MEGSGKAQDSRGAYSPVTVAITPADEKNIKTKPGTLNQGVCAWTLKKILLHVGIVCIVLIIIIIIAVVVSKGKGRKDTSQQTGATMGTTTMTQVTTTPEHTTPEHTTPAPTPPPPPGSFSWSVELNKTFDTNYDDSFSSTYRTFTSDFVSSMDSYYSPEIFADVYNATVVNVLLRNSNGNVKVEFTISLFKMDTQAQDYLRLVQTLAGYDVLSSTILS